MSSKQEDPTPAHADDGFVEAPLTPQEEAVSVLDSATPTDLTLSCRLPTSQGRIIKQNTLPPVHSCFHSYPLISSSPN